VVPVGPKSSEQRLLRITRTDDGFKREDLGAVAFVPMLEGKDKGAR
jgi:protein-L-isoaspartate O-methyltransferase